MNYGYSKLIGKSMCMLTALVVCVPLFIGGEAYANEALDAACEDGSSLACAIAMEKVWLESLDEESRKSWISRLNEMSQAERYGIEEGESAQVEVQREAQEEAPVDTTATTQTPANAQSESPNEAPSTEQNAEQNTEQNQAQSNSAQAKRSPDDACTALLEIRPMDQDWLDSLDKESRQAFLAQWKGMTDENRNRVLQAIEKCKQAEASGTSVSQSTGAATPPASSTGQSSSTGHSSSASVNAPPIKDVVLVYERFTNHVSSMRGVREFPIVRFDDGTFTKDVTGVLRKGVANSKARNGADWGQWKGSIDKLQLKIDGNSFEEVYAAQGADQMSNGLTLNKCYTGSDYTYQRSGDVGNLDTSAAYNTFCFQSNGIFTHDLSTSILNSDFISSTRSDTAGHYAVNGNVISFTYGNGTVAQRFFGVFSDPGDPKFALAIGSSIFKP